MFARVSSLAIGRTSAHEVILADFGASAGCNDNLGGLLATHGVTKQFSADNEIYRQDDPASYCYRVLAGAVRIARLLSDGRRQVSDFYFRGEMFGLEESDRHYFNAESLGNSQVQIVTREFLIKSAAANPGFASELLSYTADALRRAQEHVVLLGRKTAEERVRSFLVDMAKRSGDGTLIHLPMSRRDIADYLGLAVETVSRTLAELEGKAMIEIATSRELALRRMTAGIYR